MRQLTVKTYNKTEIKMKYIRATKYGIRLGNKGRGRPRGERRIRIQLCRLRGMREWPKQRCKFGSETVTSERSNYTLP